MAPLPQEEGETRPAREEALSPEERRERVLRTAANVLTYRARSSQALYDRLVEKGAAPEDAAWAVARLRELGYLNDADYGRLVVRDLAARGYGPGRFSFNVKGGRCEACEGGGILTIEMHFLPDIYVPCDVCKGKRYNRETLEVKYKDKNISDVLDMTVEEACVFFANIPKIARKLQTLQEVGLGYIQLGQAATTLSGGEAQRVKLANELARRDTGQTVYILDEPTTGLHVADVHRLVKVLDKLVDAGNTVIVIEHNLDVIKRADYIIDLGPEGGSGGGTIVATGTPEEVAQNPDSFTGQYLKPVLERAAELKQSQK